MVSSFNATTPRNVSVEGLCLQTAHDDAVVVQGRCTFGIAQDRKDLNNKKEKGVSGEEKEQKDVNGVMLREKISQVYTTTTTNAARQT